MTKLLFALAATLIVLLAPTPALAQKLVGDANHDGIVDMLDFSILRSEFGQCGKKLKADFNRDGCVTVIDYSLWRANFGQTR